MNLVFKVFKLFDCYQVIGRNVAAALLRDGAHGFTGHGVVVRAAHVHLDGRRLGAVR